MNPSQTTQAALSSTTRQTRLILPRLPLVLFIAVLLLCCMVLSLALPTLSAHASPAHAASVPPIDGTPPERSTPSTPPERNTPGTEQIGTHTGACGDSQVRLSPGNTPGTTTFDLFVNPSNATAAAGTYALMWSNSSTGQHGGFLDLLPILQGADMHVTYANVDTGSGQVHATLGGKAIVFPAHIFCSIGPTSAEASIP